MYYLPFKESASTTRSRKSSGVEAPAVTPRRRTPAKSSAHTSSSVPARAANDAPYYEAVEQHVAPEIYNIGDSLQAGNLLTGNRAAWHIAAKV